MPLRDHFRSPVNDERSQERLAWWLMALSGAGNWWRRSSWSVRRTKTDRRTAARLSPESLGQWLPTLPIWLRRDLCVLLPLEAGYEDTCRLLHIA